MEKFYSFILMIILGGVVANAQPGVSINVLNTTTTTVTAEFTPNAECSSYYILMSEEAIMTAYAQMMGCSVSNLVQQWGIKMATIPNML